MIEGIITGLYTLASLIKNKILAVIILTLGLIYLIATNYLNIDIIRNIDFNSIMILLGKIHWFDPIKGYGFITTKHGDDIFVHYTAIKGEGYRTVYDGQDVYYQIVRGKIGLEAKDVQPIYDNRPRPRMRYH